MYKMYARYIDGKVEKIQKELPDNLKSFSTEELAKKGWYSFFIDVSDSSDLKEFVNYTDTLENFIVTRKYFYSDKDFLVTKEQLRQVARIKLSTALLTKYDLYEILFILSGVVNDTKKQELLLDMNNFFSNYKKILQAIENAPSLESLKTIYKNLK